jgi:hypothetical protein
MEDSDRYECINRTIREFYEDNPGGGSLHIVLDDGNCEDSHIWWCIKNPIVEEEDEAALMVAGLLFCLSEDERLQLYEKDWWGMNSV